MLHVLKHGGTYFLVVVLTVVEAGYPNGSGVAGLRSQPTGASLNQIPRLQGGNGTRTLSRRRDARIGTRSRGGRKSVQMMTVSTMTETVDRTRPLIRVPGRPSTCTSTLPDRPRTTVHRPRMVRFPRGLPGWIWMCDGGPCADWSSTGWTTPWKRIAHNKRSMMWKWSNLGMGKAIHSEPTFLLCDRYHARRRSSRLPTWYGVICN